MNNKYRYMRFPAATVGLLLLAMLMTATAACSTTDGPLPPPIEAMQNRGFEVIGQFDAPGRLSGYAGLLDGTPTALYVTADGRHAIVGFAINAAGEYEDSDTLQAITTAALIMRTPLVRLDGSRATLQQFGNQPLVVNIWAAWCPPCRGELPMLDAAQAQYPGVTFAFVDLGEPMSTVQGFLGGQDLQLEHVLLDTDGTIADLIGSNEIPITLFLGAGGRLLKTHIGALSAARLAGTLQQLGLVTGATAATIAK